MKIERLNENQIRCTLNKKDLAEREMVITELAYGTDKARKLFQEMMQQAAEECDFDAENIPLMIEAIPMNADCLVLVITKVEDPEELDTRFSRFTRPGEDDVPDDMAGNMEQTIQDIIGPELDDLLRRAMELGRVKTSKELNEKIEENGKVPLYTIFSFDEFDSIAQVSRVLAPFYKGDNALYQDPATERYYLVVNFQGGTMAEYHRAIHVLLDFGKKEKMPSTRVQFFREHFSILYDKHAIQTIAQQEQ